MKRAFFFFNPCIGILALPYCVTTCRTFNFSGFIFYLWNGDKTHQSNICGLNATTYRVSWHILSKKCELLTHLRGEENPAAVWLHSSEWQYSARCYVPLKKKQNVDLYYLNLEIRNTYLFQVFLSQGFWGTHGSYFDNILHLPGMHFKR